MIPELLLDSCSLVFDFILLKWLILEGKCGISLLRSFISQKTRIIINRIDLENIAKRNFINMPELTFFFVTK
jgi:hypothetical protein